MLQIHFKSPLVIIGVNLNIANLISRIKTTESKSIYYIYIYIFRAGVQNQRVRQRKTSNERA